MTQSIQPSDKRLTSTILIVDDHAAVRAGLKNLIGSKEGWTIAGEAENGKQAVSLALQLKPAVVIMDISMPEIDGLEATRRILKELPNTAVVIVSQHDSDRVVMEAERAGARGFVVKSHLSADLIRAVDTALENNRYVSAPVAKAWQSASSDSKPRSESISDPGPHDDLDLMSGGGEMGAMMRAHDWSKTPFGPLSSWPQSLRTALRICLDSRFPILIWWGPEFRVLYNDAYIPALGTTKHPKALGEPGKQVWGDIWETIGPGLENVIRTGQATWENDQRLLFDRSGYVEESYWTYSYSAIRLASGEVGGVFSAIHEVTQQVLSARRMKTLREVADQVIRAKDETEACSLAMQSIVRNPDDCPWAMIFFCDGAKVRRVASSFESTTQLPANLDVSQADRWGIHKALSSREAQVFAVEEQDSMPSAPSGEKCRQAISIPILGPTREPIGVITLGVSPHRALDDSYREFFDSLSRNLAANINNARAYEGERKRAEALAELDRAKTLFFSNISHEFRTPLTLMLGPLEDSLGARDGLGTEHRERLEVAHRNSLRLLRLVNTLLDFSRIEAGRIQASYEPTDLCKLTSDLVSVFHSATDRAGLKLQIECRPISEPVYLDREMWEKIVFNLLSNAFKFTFEGVISVSVKEVNGRAELSVRDTGTGIPESELPHLFERFYRIKGAQGRTFEGSGIGLSLVQELARLHGGSVHVESQVKRGSTFTVSIPLGKDHLPADRIESPRTIESTGLRGEAYVQEALRWLPGSEEPEELAVTGLLPPGNALPAKKLADGTRSRILLADDNPDMRDYVARILRENYDVRTTADGVETLKAARDWHPDLILSDVMMPRMDGFGLLEAVRADDDLKSVPVILLSARAGEESRIEGLESGADDYLVKPFTARELLARVGSHLSMAQMRRETGELERKLRLDAELLAAIVASSDDAIVSKSLDGVITSWNRGAERIFGYSAEEAVGQHITLIIPDERRGEETEILSQLRQGRRIEHFQTVRRKKNGETVDVAVTISPVRDSSGKVIGASKVGRDITEEKRAAHALQESEERLRALVQASSYVMYRMSPDWSEMRQLDGRGFIVDTATPSKTWLQEYIHPDDQPLVQQAIQKAIDTKSVFELEHRVRRIDGSIGWTLSRAVPLINEEGEITEWFGAASDITDMKRAEEKYRKLSESLDGQVRLRTRELQERNAEVLRQADQLRELSWRLLRTQDDERRHIARELHDSAGQTLTILGINLAQLVQKAGRSAPDLVKEAEAIQDAVHQLHRDIRTTSYLLHPPLLDENGLSSALDWYVEGLVDRSGLDVDLQISDDFGRLPADIELVIFRLVQECLTNIHRHSGSKTASIRVIREVDEVVVEIKDQGTGMSAERLAEVQTQGSGVGIRGIRERLRQFGGSLDIESGSSGTRVVVKIPVSRMGGALRQGGVEPMQAAV